MFLLKISLSRQTKFSRPNKAISSLWISKTFRVGDIYLVTTLSGTSGYAMSLKGEISPPESSIYEQFGQD
jgi:hypothetical protein